MTKTIISTYCSPIQKKNIWIATNKAVFGISKTGEIKKIDDSGSNNIFETKDGKIWIDSGGNDVGIRVFSYQNENSAPILTATYTKKDGLPNNPFTTAVAETTDGRIFISSDKTLCEFLPNAKESELKFRVYENVVGTSETDKSGNIWFIFPGKGAARFSPNSFAVSDERDGLPKEGITSIFGNEKGEVFFTSGNKILVRASGGKFESLVPFRLSSRNWIGTFLDFQSPEGEFWIPSQDGLLRYPKVENFADLAKTLPKKIYTAADGLFATPVYNLFEDSRGDVWISASNGDNFLLRFEKTTEKFYRYSFENFVPKQSGVVSFGEDSSGNIWIAFYFGQIVRYKDGKFRTFTDENLIPQGYVNNMLSDKKGRFWLATASRGLFRVDNPNDETPVFSNVSTANGLSSNQTLCLTEDSFGHLYIGTGRGINRLEPETSQIKIFTTADGLPGNIISQCYKDSNGVLWFSSNNSLIKFTPKADEISKKPPIFIDGISVNGMPRNISELGETAIENLELTSDEKQIQISFFAISFDSGETLRYQYKLDGQDWSVPSEQRIVDFNLSAGSYKFSVQAVNSDGVTSEKPSTISFKILPPFYQRWWFLLLSFLLVSSILFVIYRRRTENLRRINSALTETNLAEENLRKSREERIAELQRVRTRIATDLHDDIGSSLTQISVYSELARQREHENGKAGEPLDMISNVAGELVDTMSDIVWAINPKKDHLQDLTQRMRRFAANVLTAKDIDLEFSAPNSDADIPLGANIRREVFLIFKETVNNIVKHSEASEAEIIFSTGNNFLTINFKDNGKGFDQTAKSEENGNDWKRFRGGNGLLNMKKRAADLGGSYEIKSAIGNGTTVILQIPLDLSEQPA